jgi:hypothetical protein
VPGVQGVESAVDHGHRAAVVAERCGRYDHR